MGHRSLNFLSFNVRSLIDRSRQIELHRSLTSNNIDIGFIQETHLRGNKKIYLNEYDFINSNASVGVAIAIGRKTKFKHLRIEDLGFNAVFAEIELKTNNILKKFLVGSIYIPTNFSSSGLSNGLDKILHRARTFDGFVLGGDLNAKNPMWGDGVENLNGKALNKWLQDNSIDVVRLCDSNPSFPNGASFLDHFLVSTNILDICNSNFSIESLHSFSDHFPIKLKLEIGSLELALRTPRHFTSYKNTRWDVFRNDLDTLSDNKMPPSNRNLSNHELDLLIEELTSLITATHDVHSQKIEIIDKKLPLPVNIENLFKTSHGWQKDLKKIFHRTGNRVSWEYKILSKQVQLLKIILKELVAINDSDLFGKKLKKIIPGPRAFKDVNNIIGKRKTTPFCKEIHSNGSTVSNSEEISETFKSFYQGVFSENIPAEAVANIEENVSQWVEQVPQHIYTFDNSFTAIENDDVIHFTNRDNIKSIIANINNKKSSGIDEISNFIIKKLPDKTLTFLVIVFNNCLNNGYFPKAWKSAKILPIKKKEASDRVEDFRPISLLSNIGKIFEHVIKEKLENAFVINPIPAFQFGFQKQHSTQHALLKFHNDVCSNLRERKCTVAISLDIEKAFDSAFHKGILFKLTELRADPSLVKMFQSYFTDRVFRVQIGNYISSPGAVCSGVPQGSVLAPLLFNIFLNDFPHQVANSTSILYADDCLIYSHDFSPINALAKAQRHLSTLNSFYKTWGFKINARKSEAICIRNASGKGPSYVVPESKILYLLLDGVEIPFRTSIQYLGIHFNNLFKFNVHARKTLIKTKRICGMFSNLFNNKHLPDTTKLLLYKVAVRPVLLYGFPIWFSISPTVAMELEILERKILRKCINKFFESYTKRFSNAYIYENAGVLPLCNYALSLQRKFVEKLSTHDNTLMNEISHREENTDWSSCYYLSPLSVQQIYPDNPLDPLALCSFYQKAATGTHRG